MNPEEPSVPAQPKLNELVSALPLEQPESLLAFLAGRGIQTLEDVRRAGGLGRMEGLPLVADHPAVRRLESLANLSAVSSDAGVSTALIERGYDSLLAIARAPRTEFVAAVRDQVGDFKAARMHVEARAQTMYLNNVLTGILAARANGHSTLPYGDVQAIESDTEPTKCGCKDCEAAVSPLAYLADLLDYAVTHLYRSFESITVVSTSAVVSTMAIGDGTVVGGRLWVFARGADHALWYIVRDQPDGKWSSWQSLGGSVVGNIAVGVNLNGSLEVFARGTDKALWHISQTRPNWSGWASLGGTLAGDPTVGYKLDRRLEVFTHGSDNALWHIWQTNLFGNWSGWASLGGNLTSDPAVLGNTDGRLEVFVRGVDNALYHIWQTQPNGNWSSWASLGGTLKGAPVVGYNVDGRLEVFVRGVDNALHHVWQTQPNGNWSSWASLLGVLVSNPAVVTNADGRQEVFVRGVDNALYHIWQTQPNGNWSSWFSLGGVLDSDPAVGRNQDGSLEVFVKGGESILYHKHQIPAQGTWSDWIGEHQIPVLMDDLVKVLHQPFDKLPASCEAADEQFRQARICIEVLYSYLAGLVGEYYDDSNFSNLKIIRIDPTVDFAWGDGSPDASIEPDTFSVRWTGQIVPRFSETYTFTTTSDDGVRLWIDGQLIIENWTVHPPMDNSGTIALTAGTAYDIILEFYEDHGGATIKLFWHRPSQGKEIVPASQLRPISAAQSAGLGKDYLLATYTTLLTRLGTSFTEIRLARSADPETRKALADRLGIDLGATRPDNLDGLFLDPTTVPAVVTESKLEAIFGLRETARDPVTDTPSPSSLEKWRLEHLRTLWSQQDWPTDPYSQDYQPQEERLPIIDPDIIGPDDFRVPIKKTNPPDKPFDIWLNRRDWVVDKRLQSFATWTKERRGQIVPDLGKMLDTMKDPVSYKYDTTTKLLKPWPTTPPIDLDKLRRDLTQATDDKTRKDAIDSVKDLHLTVESFTRLMDLRDKDTFAESDPRYDGLTSEEWQEVYSILTQATKVAFYTTWRQEEQGDPNQAPKVRLGPADFWFSLREPVEGDWPPLLLGSRPLIDPERVSDVDLAKVIPGKAALVLWQARRARLDQMHKNLEAKREDPINGGFLSMLMLALGDPNPGDPLPADVNLDTLYNNLKNNVDVENTKQKIREKLYMTPEAFLRLMTIKSKEAETDPTKKPTEAEYEEVYTVLTSAQKTKREYPQWLDEEKQLPLIDPESVKTSDLPEPTAGKEALDLWQARLARLDQIHVGLKAEREQGGFDAMLKLALGDPLPYDLDALYADLQNEIDVDETERKITTGLHMTVEDFKRLMGVKIKSKSQGSESAPPTTTEWAEVYAILTSAQKMRVEYPTWLSEEQQLGLTPQNYWRVFKAALPRWRASAAARQQWKQALRTRSSAPIIDSDVIGPGDLKNPVAGDPAYDLWEERNQWINDQWDKLDAARKPPDGTDLDGFKAVLQASNLGLSADDLVKLADKRKEGNDITARLDQLSLDNPAFSYLLRIHDLAGANTQHIVLESEWDEVYSILTQANKRREFAEWREKERGNTPQNQISLSPDYFRFPEEDKTVFPPPPPPWEPVAWRSTWEMRRDWQDTLQSRMDQEEAVKNALQSVVSATEEATLPMLRDALIMATDAKGTTLEDKAKWITDRLLIDTRVNGCQMTTRVSQAIETIQGLLWSLRTGQLKDKDAYPDLDLAAPDFDEEWDWIGSYASWRAAMFVFMYPENILLPSLRKHQTPAFRDLVNELRNNRRLTPEQARQAAQTYSEYFRDVCSLEVEACAKASARINDANSNGYADKSYRDLTFLFARSPASKKAYWCTRDAQATPDSQTYWIELSALQDVMNLIGAVSYRVDPQDRFIYLFARTLEKGEQKLVFVRYDLESAKGWDTEVTSLELPNNATEFTAKLRQTAEQDPPALSVQLSKDEIYSGRLDKKGTGWDRSSPERICIHGNWRHFSPLSGHPFNASFDCSGDPYPPKLDAVIVGDFDGDGREEIAVAEKQDYKNHFWVMGFQSGVGWRHLDFDCNKDEAIAARFAAVGDFDGDRRDEIAVAKDMDGSEFWVMDYQPGTGWVHLDNDFRCSMERTKAVSAVVGDFDGDEMDEIAICQDLRMGTGFWVMDYQPGTGWRHLTDFSCQPDIDSQKNIGASFAVAGDFDGDGRDEIAVAPTLGGTEGNDFWVMDFDPYSQSWSHLSSRRSGRPYHASFDCSSESGDNYPYPAKFAVVGDFDGDGRDEIAVAPDVPNDDLNPSKGNHFWVMDFVPGVGWGNLDFDCNKDEAIAAQFATVGDFDHDERDEIAIAPSGPNLSDTQRNDFWVLDFDPPTRTWRHLSPRGGGFPKDASFDCSGEPIPAAYAWAGDFDHDGQYEIAIAPDLLGTKGNDFWVMRFDLIKEAWLPDCSYTDFAPKGTPIEITSKLSEAQLRARQQLSRTTYLANDPGPRSNLDYIKEAWYFVPLYLALQLQARGQYMAALDWFRTIYDYSAPLGQRKIYYGLIKEERPDGTPDRPANWLLDPLNPHLIAETRPYTYTRYTLFSLIRCFLGYADAEFTRDTAESVPRARTLYLTALELLATLQSAQPSESCEAPIEELDAWVRPKILSEAPQWLPVWFELKRELAAIPDLSTLTNVVDDLNPVLKDGQWVQRLSSARAIIAQATSPSPSPTMAEVLYDKTCLLDKAYTAIMASPVLAEASLGVGSAAGKGFLQSISTASGISAATLESEKVDLPWLRNTLMNLTEGQRVLTAVATTAPGTAVSASNTPVDVQPSFGYVPILSFPFCIPPNPVLNALKLHAELNLYKLRNCRNIAGMRRQLDAFAAPTHTTSGLPTIGAGGQLILPGTAVLHPTPYRYKVLIERTKQLVSIAQQMEAAMLSALEKRDLEAYNLLKARQDVRMARAGVQLQDLKVKEAEDGATLASLQQQRAQIQVDHYQKLLDVGISPLEETALVVMGSSGLAQLMAAGLSFAIPGDPTTSYKDRLSAVAQGLSSLAASLSTTASILTTLASYERRKQDWEFQRDLANQDVEIGKQQVATATDHVRVAGQERAIAELQTEHAEAMVEFLSTKFTNVELYEWMSSVLENVYSFFLQQATSVAKLAENQLAFERQETPPSYIQSDYSEAPSDEMSTSGDGHAPDRHGLTGSARLLQDIYQLDQYAFENDKRKLQLSKTISLARLAPYEFQRFRETGVLSFGTALDLFDRDFPGHYLRLIKRVRTSVVALIPPTQGIHATLTNTGHSRVVIGPDVFQTVVVRRDPDSVALTAPINASGLFELEPQSEMLFPFEGLGVGTAWEFRMPLAANLFDYNTIADVLLTIDYTALDSFDYRQQVIQTLPATVSAERPFSFRQEFADAWYDLHNPDQATPPAMTVTFETRREDFPPNIADLKIQHVLLYFACTDGNVFEENVTLKFKAKGEANTVGGDAKSNDGVISTRRGNAGSWLAMTDKKSPAGVWMLSFTPEIRKLFADEVIEDILLVITYSGRTPEWPA